MASQMMINNTIHCKVSFNGQIRRFAVQRNTEFTSLKETIHRLLSVNDEFVLKYRDDESDYVLLESQDEFWTALSLSSLLRLVVEPKKAPQAPGSNCDGQSMMYRKRHHHHEKKEHHHGPHHHDHKDGHRHHHDHKNKHHPHHDRKDKHHPHHDHKDKHPHEDHKVKSEEQRRLRAEKKLTFINQRLMDFGSEDSALTPRALMKKQKLLKKKERIESCLRGECYNQRKRQGLITPEEEQHNLSIKSQIMAVKVEASKVKARQREIKMMLQDKEGDKALLDELSTLKEQKKLLWTQKRALIDQLHV
jgi:hypothetical protein